MWAYRLALVVLAVAVSTGSIGLEPAQSGSGEADETMPYYFLDWQAVVEGSAPNVITLVEVAPGFCMGHVESVTTIGPDEGWSDGGITKTLSLRPRANEPCVFEPTAMVHEGNAATIYGQAVDLGMNSCLPGTQCVHHAESGGEPEGGASDGGNVDVYNYWCRIADAWAHTGNADPPTVVYTRTYEVFEFCYDHAKAWVEDESDGHLCFANSAAAWYLIPDTCIEEGRDFGPGSQVHLGYSGEYEKQVGQYMYSHYMSSTIAGNYVGLYTCSGAIQGVWEGVANTENCNASVPELHQV